MLFTAAGAAPEAVDSAGMASGAGGCPSGEGKP